MKILAPAGNFACLKSAIANGADEVYLGINDFNARNNIDGFTLQTLKEAVTYAHIFGVKVHLAINILFTDSELQSALDTVVDAFNMGVDAFIIQDLALIDLVSKNYPQIEIHLSTQAGIHNLEGVLALKKYNVKRVVLSRETPLEEIKRIRDNCDIEIEYFAHGALCVSFSGNCYLSSYLHDASGNRGKCKQLCRLPFTLQKDGKTLKKGYLLSAKDFDMTKRLSQLEQAGVTAIKIEGRARRPYYVGAVTKEYYNALNGIAPDYDTLKLAFNRGFTEGYFNGNGNVISNIQNHQGLTIGKVVKVANGKNFNQVFFTSKIALSPKSTFKFFDGDIENNTLTAFDLKDLSNGNYMLTTTQKVTVGNTVRLIADFNKEKDIELQTKKRNITVEITAKENCPITVCTCVDGKKISVQGQVLTVAKNQPLTKLELQENFNKSEYFNANISISALDNVFIGKKQLNELRRDFYQKLYERFESAPSHALKKTSVPKNLPFKPLRDFEIIENLSTTTNSKRVIYSPQTYSVEDVKKFVALMKKQNKTPYLDTPNFALKKDVELLKEIIKSTGVKIVANNYYALTLSDDAIIGGGLNVYNTYLANLYDRPIIFAESDIESKTPFPYMTLRHCPMKNHLNASCNNCPYQDGYSLVMDSGKKLKLKRKKLSTCTFYLTD